MLNDVEQKRMRIDIETCRDPELLAAEVRRLEAVIAAWEATLADEEREAIVVACAYMDKLGNRNTSAQETLMALLARTK
jgi:hypothetical protein